jgi:outer membrane protein OmpA-like peptidoglycan-associated protein
MSSHSHNSCGRVPVPLLAVVAMLCSLGTLAAGQDQPAPKWELYGGYSAFYPGCDVHGLVPGGVLPVSSCLKWSLRGAGATVTYNFSRWLGLTGDISGHWGNGDSTLAERIENVDFYNLSVGPKITFRSRHFSPFLEALVGEHRLTSDLFGADDEVGFMGGGGLDLNLNRHIAWRMFRADFVFSNHQYGPESIVPATDVRGARLQSGLVFLFGPGPAGPPVSASCNTHPSEVMVGEPATATAAGSNFNPSHSLSYTWTSSGGTVSGKGNSATIDTNGMAGGSYTVTAHISDALMKKGGEASCMAAFIVKEPPKSPPVVSCLSSPSNVQAGMSSTVSCTCSSPDNVAVTVGGWTASGGSISGGGANNNNAVLDTSGASAGPITVNASCSDSRGLNTQATAQVMVENPPPPSPEFLQLETRLALHSIYFPTAQPRVENPNGGLLVSQEQTLTALAEDFKKYLESKPDARLTLGGHSDPRASVDYNQALSERRVARVRAFLIENGVPAASLETKAFGEERNLTEAEVREAVEQNPELTPEQRQRVLDNLQTVLFASNRRVDITLSTTGQNSVQQYPFNAADSLTLLEQKATSRATRSARKNVKAKAQR